MSAAVVAELRPSLLLDATGKGLSAMDPEVCALILALLKSRRLEVSSLSLRKAAASRADVAEEALHKTMELLAIEQHTSSQLSQKLQTQELFAVKEQAKSMEKPFTASKAELISAQQLSSEAASGSSELALLQKTKQVDDKALRQAHEKINQLKADLALARQAKLEASTYDKQPAAGLPEADVEIAALQDDKAHKGETNALATAKQELCASQRQIQQLTDDLKQLQDKTDKTSVDNIMSQCLSGFPLPDGPSRDFYSRPPDDSVSVNQLASYQYHHRLLALMFKRGLPWRGTWELLPVTAPEGIDLYQLRYHQAGLMGQGAFGTVSYGQLWVGDAAGEGLGTGWTWGWQAVAIKQVLRGPAAARELAALTKLKHRIKQLQKEAESANEEPEEPHIIQPLHSYDAAIAGQQCTVFITRFSEGLELHAALDDLWHKTELAEAGPAQDYAQEFWLWVLKQCIRQLLEGLAFLHNCGLVHGDVKSDNAKVQVDWNNRHVHLELLDLSASCPNGTMISEINCCPSYMSPEALGTGTMQGTYLYASDVWSAGCTLFELVAGCPPFDTWASRQLEGSAQRQKQLKQLRAALKRTKSGWQRGLVAHDNMSGMALLQSKLSAYPRSCQA